jgi:transglutaminase-like putative cysteine protease
MAQSIGIAHDTLYRFDIAREQCELAVRLEPRGSSAQKIHATQICVSPAPATHVRTLDAWGNALDRFSLVGPLTDIRIRSSSLLELHDRPTAGLGPSPEHFMCEAPAEAKRRGGALWRWAAQCLPDDRLRPADIEALCRLIGRDFAYDPAATAVARPVEQIFAACRGVCQDFASLAIAVLRARGTTCRFNTGYLLQHVSSAPRTIAGHAWFSAWSPDQGWLDFDPLAPGMPRALLAMGATQSDIPPVAGSSIGPPGRQSMQVEITVRLAAPGAALASCHGFSKQAS